MSLNKSHHDVIIRPIVSEKSYGLIDRNGQYTFEVAPTANKTDTLNRKGKTRRTKFGMGKRKDTKRAIVTLMSMVPDFRVTRTPSVPL